MQTVDNHAQSKGSQLTLSLILVFSCLMLWLMPVTHELCVKLDVKAFNLLNQSLLLSHKWQLFWGYLNHPQETWLNLVLMVSINLWALFSLPKYERAAAVLKLIYFWLFFQIVLLFTHQLFAEWLVIERNSPSLVLEPWLLLSDSLNMNLKVASRHSFPAGHALVLVFWAKFTSLYAPTRFKPLLWSVVVLFTLPRLFSGAHWLSDVVFTAFYSWLWFNISIITPLYSRALRSIESLILNLQQKTRKIAGTI